VAQPPETKRRVCRPAISPLRSGSGTAVEDNPLLSNIRFFLEPNSGVLDMNQPANLERLASIDKLLQVSPGSTVLLRGHVDDAMVPEFHRQGPFLRAHEWLSRRWN
jgi:NitT/TauT family transport system substrate-binding protein